MTRGVAGTCGEDTPPRLERSGRAGRATTPLAVRCRIGCRMGMVVVGGG